MSTFSCKANGEGSYHSSCKKHTQAHIRYSEQDFIAKIKHEIEKVLINW